MKISGKSKAIINIPSKKRPGRKSMQIHGINKLSLWIGGITFTKTAVLKQSLANILLLSRDIYFQCLIAMEEKPNLKQTVLNMSTEQRSVMKSITKWSGNGNCNVLN